MAALAATGGEGLPSHAWMTIEGVGGRVGADAVEACKVIVLGTITGWRERGEGTMTFLGSMDLGAEGLAACVVSCGRWWASPVRVRW